MKLKVKVTFVYYAAIESVGLEMNQKEYGVCIRTVSGKEYFVNVGAKENAIHYRSRIISAIDKLEFFDLD